MSIFLIRGTEGSSIFNGIIVFSESVGRPDIRLFRMEIYQYGQLHTLYSGKHWYVRRIWTIRCPTRSGHCVLRFFRLRCCQYSAQEAKNPKRDMPIGILVSLLVCTILYMLFAHVMTGVAHYSEFGGQQGIAPVAIAIGHMGEVDASGVLHPDYPWMNRAIVIAILLGYCSVIMVTLLGQSRVFLSMSRDGLLPPLFSHIHENSARRHEVISCLCYWSVHWQLSFRRA